MNLGNSTLTINMDEFIDTIERLAARLPASVNVTIEKGHGDGRTDSWLRVVIICHTAAGEIVYWSRPHLGGMLDVQVVRDVEDGSAQDVYSKHLEGLSVAEMTREWLAMLRKLRLDEC